MIFRFSLLPHRYKAIGWFLFLPAAIAGSIVAATGYEVSWLSTHVISLYEADLFTNTRTTQLTDLHWFHWVEANLTTTIIGVLLIAGALLVGFSKERIEDEFISRLRLSSLLWAVCVNYGLLLLAFLLVYGLSFLSVMMYNMFTVLLLFIIRFHYLLYKSNKAVLVEK